MRVSQSADGLFRVTYPEELFETRGRYAYIRVELKEPQANTEVSIKLEGEGSIPAGRNVTLTRKTNAAGVAVFPIGPVCESLMQGIGGALIKFAITVADTVHNVSGLWAIPGFADREIPTMDSLRPGFYPSAPCIVVYPNAGFDQQLFCPYIKGERFITTASAVTRSQFIGVSDTKNPIIEFRPILINISDRGKPIAVGTSRTDYTTAQIKTYYDECADGVFLKWTDAAGVPYLYRWTLEKQTDEMAVDSTYSQLNDNLQPFDVQTKTMGKRYTLHSRIVERDIYEMCRTILGCQELFMFVGGRGEQNDPDAWVRFMIEDAESEDTGSPMQDLVIDIVRYEHL